MHISVNITSKINNDNVLNRKEFLFFSQKEKNFINFANPSTNNDNVLNHKEIKLVCNNE